MPHATPLITTIVGGLVAAFIFGAIAVRLRMPAIVGYLFAGTLVGPFTPGYIADLTLAPQLAELGVILLMFGVGLHFSLGDLLSVRKIAIPGAVTQILIATLFGVGMGTALGWPLGEGIVFGLILSTASTVVLLRALQERNLIETHQGRIAVGWLIVEDIAMVLALVLLPPLAGLLGGHNPENGAVDPNAWEIASTLLITLGKVTAFVALMLIVGRRAVPYLLKRIELLKSKELFRLGVMAIVLGIAYGATALFEVSFALGAFFAGMVLAESEFSHRAAEESLPFRDIFAILFFVSVGMLFDPSALVEDPVAVFVTFLIIVVGKSLAALVIVRAFGHPMSTALTISASLAQIGEFAFILAGLGHYLGLVSARAHTLVIAGSILSILFNPLLFKLLERYNSTPPALPNVPEPTL